MAATAVILLVRFRSRLPLDAVRSIMTERAPAFRTLTGLRQKYYLRDESTGEYGGLYLWDSKAALDDYRRSELRATIAQAYEVEGEPRVEVYEVLEPLRDDG